MSRTGHRAYRRNRARALTGATVCYICGQPLDPTLPPGQPDSPEAHHLDPVGKGGHNLGPVVATHRLCNQRLGTKTEAPEMNKRHARRW